MNKQNLILVILGIVLVLSLPTTSAYRFVVISDTHLETDNIEPAIEKIISLNPKPDFVVHAGDMIMADNVKSPVDKKAWKQVYDEIITPLKDAEIKFLPVRGNHDAGFKEMFIDTNDIPQYYYAYFNGIDSMNNNNDLFLFLDGTGFNIGEEQMNWLKSELNSPAKNYKNLFVFSHEPLADLCKKDDCSGQLAPNDELVNLFKDAGVTIFFNGHQHFYEKVKYKGINLVTSGYLANYQYIPKSTGIKQKPTFVVVDVNGPNNVQVNAYQESNGNFDSMFDKKGWAGRNLKATLGPDFEPFSLGGTTGAAASTPTKGVSVSQSLKILHIGDSHTAGYYGQELESQFESAGHEVTTYGCVGAVAQDYIIGMKKCDKGSMINGETKDYSLPAIKKILTDNSEADVVIISLGTNYLDDKGVYNDQESIQTLSELIHNKPNIQCYWVGAPKESTQSINPAWINDALKDILGDSCKFIDSIGLTDANKLGTGGIHYTAEGGKEWAEGVYNIITADMGISSTEETVEDDAEEKGTVEEDSVEESAESSSQPSNSQLCEIDSVWITAGTSLNIENAVKTLVFTLTGWQPFDKICKPQSKSTPSGKGVTLPADMADVEKYIQEAGKEFDVDPALIKTIMKYESNFKQFAKSDTGCRGLMQVCKWANYKEIVSKYGLEDNAYDAKASIYVGTYILKEKEKSVDGTCGVACQVAAYNIGQCVINAAAKKAEDKSSWDNVYKKITVQIMDDCSPKGYKPWKTTKKEKKIKDLKNYVNKIMKAYNS